MTTPFKLDLLPLDPQIEFIEDGHKYLYHDKRIGTIEPKSVSTVLTATEAKCFNYGIWRKSLEKKGLTQDQADAFMAWHRQNRAQVGTDFHLLAEHRFKDYDRFKLEDFDGKVSPESMAIFRHFDRNFLPRVRRVFIIEAPMIHKCFIYTGTPDLLVELDDGSIWLIDYKTIQDGSNNYAGLLWWLRYHGLAEALATAIANPPNVHEKNNRSWRGRKEWLLQIAGYVELVRANHGIVVRHGGNLVLNDSKFRLHEYNGADLDQAWSRFAGFLLEYHTRQASLGNPVSQLALGSVSTLFRATVQAEQFA